MRFESLGKSIRRFGRRGVIAAAVAAGVTFMGGCLDKGFLDQTEMGRFSPDPLVVPILDNLNTGVDENTAMFQQSEEPSAADLVAETQDYTVTAGDLIYVSITDLAGPGIETVKQVRVTHTGRVSLPFINQIQVEGLTEAQAEEAISRAYRDAQIIQNAQVSVITVEPRGRTFSIVGAVGRAGLIPIYKSDFRLLDALVASGDYDVTRGTRGYEEIFILRPREEGEDTARPQTPTNEPPADVLRPRGDAGNINDLRRATYLRVQPTTEPSLDPSMGTPATQPAEGSQPTEGAEGRFVIIDGKPVLVGGSEAATAPADAGNPAGNTGDPMAPPVTSTTPQPDGGMAATDALGQPFEFNAPTEPDNMRVIRIPVEKLLRGELKYNIVIRPGDTIFVPPLEGVYYMGGHVARVGVYGLGNGNKVSLMDAIIAAGGLDQVAVPWRTQIIRRVGDSQIFTNVDLTKIFEGTEPDIYIKRDDKITVGTQAWAPFLAAIRNGFRFTYGFGFLYDRNYYDENDNNN